MHRPAIKTRRLILRPFRLSDATAFQRLAGDRAIADTTSNVPHPYEDGLAEAWIATHQPGFEAGELASFAVVLREGMELVGTGSLTIEKSSATAELGYWIGVPFWKSGYCSEAVKALIDYGFDSLRLHRIFAHHLTRNPASGRVMSKAGMIFERTSKLWFDQRDAEEEVRFYEVSRETWTKSMSPR